MNPETLGDKAGKMNNTILGCMSAVLCEILFGFSFLFTKKALACVEPCDLLGWRFLTAAVLLSLCVLFRMVHVDLRGKKLLSLLGVGLLFPGAYYIFEASGMRRITSSETGMLVASVPAVTLFLSILILRERPRWVQICGIFLSISGVILCVLAKAESAVFDPAGYLFIIAGILSFCFFTVFGRKIQDFSAVEKTFVLLLEGALIYFGTAVVKNLFTGHLCDFFLLPLNNRDLLYAMLYLGSACSVICLFLCNFAIAKIGPSRFTSFIGIETIVAISGGILLLGEPVFYLQIIGSAVILCGIYLANRNRTK